MINAIYSELVLVDTTFIMNEERNCGHKNLGKFLLNKVEILKNFCYNIIKNIKIYYEEVFSLSTVITYHTSDFNIMVCDTRKTTFTADGKKKFDDSVLKMHYINNYGFISGIGVGELIQNTFNHFKSGDPCDDNLPCSFFSAYIDIASSCSKDVLERLNNVY